MSDVDEKSILDEIVSFYVNFEKPEARYGVRKNENHKYDVYALISVGESSRYFFQGKPRFLSLKKLRFHAEGDILQEYAVDLCDIINKSHTHEKTNKLTKSNGCDESFKKGMSAKLKTKTSAEASLTSGKEVSKHNEDILETQVNFQKGEFDVHVTQKKLTWTLTAPDGERLTTKKKMKYTESKSKAVRFWISITRDCWFFGGGDGLPERKPKPIMMKYFLYREYRNKIDEEIARKNTLDKIIERKNEIIISRSLPIQ